MSDKSDNASRCSFFGNGGGGDLIGMQCAPGDIRSRGLFSAYDNILEMVLVTDADLKVVFVNAAVERVLGGTGRGGDCQIMTCHY